MWVEIFELFCVIAAFSLVISSCKIVFEWPKVQHSENLPLVTFAVTKRMYVGLCCLSVFLSPKF